MANTYESHFSTWATEADFAKISQYGFNTVRIPIGYWAYDNSNSPYYKGSQASYLDQAVCVKDVYVCLLMLMMILDRLGVIERPHGDY